MNQTLTNQGPTAMRAGVASYPAQPFPALRASATAAAGEHQPASAADKSPGRTGFPLPPKARAVEQRPREQWTIQQMMDVEAGQQAMMSVEGEVRRLARARGATPAALESLVQQARITFRPVGARVYPLAADGQTVLASANGERILTVAEWAERQMAAAPTEFDPVAPDAAPLPPRNPFKKRFWNVAEQMRVYREDPEFAGKLRAEAWQAES